MVEEEEVRSIGGGGGGGGQEYRRWRRVILTCAWSSTVSVERCRVCV